MLNFDYFLDGEYDSIEAAIAKSKSTTFETTIYDESNKMVASYSFFGGTRYYR